MTGNDPPRELQLSSSNSSAGCRPSLTQSDFHHEVLCSKMFQPGVSKPMYIVQRTYIYIYIEIEIYITYNIICIVLKDIKGNNLNHPDEQLPKKLSNTQDLLWIATWSELGWPFGRILKIINHKGIYKTSQ